MAYDAYAAERISKILNDRKANFYEKKMFGGVCYMVDEKMCCGLMYNKKRAIDFLMARIGSEKVESSLEKNTACLPMDFTGRPMKDYIFVTADGYDKEEDLEYLTLN